MALHAEPRLNWASSPTHCSTAEERLRGTASSTSASRRGSVASVASALLAGGQREQANAELESLLAEASQHAEWNIAYEAHALLYRVLAQVGDARARELLDLGYRALCSLADRHADLVPRETMMRGSFLRRELCAAWEAAALASAR